MKTIYLLRHSKAEKNLLCKDIERPLTTRGKNDAEKMGEYFIKSQFNAEYIACSSAVRTKSTLDHFVKTAKIQPKIEYFDDLYFSGFSAGLDIFREAKEEYSSIMLVGHCPDIQDLADQLSEKGFYFEKFNTSGLCVIDFNCESWKFISNGKGIIREYKSPKNIALEP